MKLGERWLREWVDLSLTREELLEQLTMLGLEVDFTLPASPPLEGLVVGRIVSAEAHPDADSLRVCRVDAGGEAVDVVCGAPNARDGLLAPFAPVGSVLPGGMKLKAAKLRGVVSNGMLCSEKELEISEEADGLMELDADATPGTPLVEALALDDIIIDIDLTPNRGDCLSVRGVARELAARNAVELQQPDVPAIDAVLDDTFPISLDEPDGCPRYVGRIVRGIDPDAATPRWMQEKLRRCGIRSISPTVDITAYVMLELGQPMHAFDFDNLTGGIHVRRAHDGETLTMLDGTELALDTGTLMIADSERAVAIAGIMGGEASGVSDSTRDVFLESAFFSTDWIAGRPRRYGLFTDAGQRFERGVDPQRQREAIERATRLLLDICGGEPGPVIEAVSDEHLPKTPRVGLRSSRATRLIGESFSDAEIERSLSRLGMHVEGTGAGEWQVEPPSHRFDIRIEADLIEELARLRGYDNIVESKPAYVPRTHPGTEPGTGIAGLRGRLLQRGYDEAVTYSFVDEDLNRLIDVGVEPLPLANPISSELAVMRSTLWPGLITSVQHNLNRQQHRVRLFETGLAFVPAGNELTQVAKIAGAATGSVDPEQWSGAARPIDFFDLKGDVQALLETARVRDVAYPVGSHAALHPGQCAEVHGGGERLGWLGALHPALQQRLDIDQPVYLFELALPPLVGSPRPNVHEISRFPSIRRDISVEVDASVPAQQLLDVVVEVAPSSLTDVTIFDVYTGEHVVSGRKSVSLGLILQDLSRTLTDHEVAETVDQILTGLNKKLGAKLRE